MAVKLGYGYEICAFLDAVDSSDAEGIFACLSKSHPPKSQRLAAMNAAGAGYERAINASAEKDFVPSELHIEREMVLNAIRNNPKISQVAIHEQTGISISNVRNIIKQLQAEGVLVRFGT